MKIESYQMLNYIGTKLIRAIPMNRLDYNQYRGWKLPEDEEGSDAGFLVEYVDGGKSNHPDHRGYISWSPTDVFLKSYRQVENLTFSQALEAMKIGVRVARKGWNGKGMFIYRVPGGDFPALTDVARETFGETVPYGEYAAIKTAQGEVMPWQPSNGDMFAEDWVVLA